MRWKVRTGWQPALGIGLVLIAALLSGCVAAAVVAGGVAAGAGGGTVAYVRGEQVQIHNAPFEQTWTATQNALSQLEIKVLKTEKDADGSGIEALQADNTSVTIRVEPLGTDAARVRIRIGTLGSQVGSERIQAKIASNLGGR